MFNASRNSSRVGLVCYFYYYFFCLVFGVWTLFSLHCKGQFAMNSCLLLYEWSDHCTHTQHSSLFWALFLFVHVCMFVVFSNAENLDKRLNEIQLIWTNDDDKHNQNSIYTNHLYKSNLNWVPTRSIAHPREKERDEKKIDFSVDGKNPSCLCCMHQRS